MSKLYTVLVRHVAPKDSHDAIEALVIADDEVALRDRIDREFNYDRWAERDADGETWEVCGEEQCGELAEETVLERMLRLRGDFNDDDNDSLYEDAYYGCTLYGWDLGVELAPEQIPVLLSLGMIHDWREPAEGTETPAEASTPSLTALEASQRLDGGEYRREGSATLFAEMKAAGLVALFGASDDLAEFRGAIDDETGCGTIYLTKAGLLANECDDWDCPHYREAKKAATAIEAIFGAADFDWTYKTAIPHETFVINEDGVPFCRGIVFALSDVPA